MPFLTFNLLYSLAIVVSAPYGIVRRLIELYPQSVRCTDDQNMLPLHLASKF
jgi:hypothetical protein